ncbi:unnamed protein product [Arabidopsis thaliana]|uniref:Uncharacterized protein n=1 Tax=Arabidopsis thaliana TaxID=3702 RepID=A0A5S9XUL0_ARATH|nr:unnamed protein product [Arabidopsis thaliana]
MEIMDHLERQKQSKVEKKRERDLLKNISSDSTRGDLLLDSRHWRFVFRSVQVELSFFGISQLVQDKPTLFGRKYHECAGSLNGVNLMSRGRVVVFKIEESDLSSSDSETSGDKICFG